MTQKQTKKPWFLKRWICNLLAWLDESIFGIRLREDAKFVITAQPFWFSAVVSFWCGAVAFVYSMFTDNAAAHEGLSIGAGVALVVGLLFSVWYLYKTLGLLPTTGLKIFRSVYILVLWVLGFFAGFFAAYVALFVMIFLFVLMVLFQAVFGDSDKKSKIITLEDGTKLKHEKGLLGEDYYTDENGRNYDCNNDILGGKTYSKKS